MTIATASADATHEVLQVRDLPLADLQTLLARHALDLERMEDDTPIPGSFWGEGLGQILRRHPVQPRRQIRSGHLRGSAHPVLPVIGQAGAQRRAQDHAFGRGAGTGHLF